MITVPSCRRCHKTTSKDDEYFRLVLAMRDDLNDHPDIQGGVSRAALSSLARPDARGYARAFFQTIHEVPMRTPAGLHVARTGYVADGVRVHREIARITRGLFFHDRRKPLNQDAVVRVLDDSFVDWSRVPAEARQGAVRLAGELAAAPQVQIGEVFQYSRAITDQDEATSAWRLVFYRKAVFLSLTAPAVTI